MPRYDSGRQSPRLQDNNNNNNSPKTDASSVSDVELKQLVIEIKQQNDRLIASQEDILQRLVNSSKEISELKAENTELKNKINVMSENFTRLDQYSRKDVAILTGLQFTAGENRSELEKNVIKKINTVTGKVFTERDFSAIHRNGNRNKDNGRPPSVTVKFLRLNDKELLFDRNVISKRRAMFPSLNFHHCLCKSLIDVQSSISSHNDVKFVRFMGGNKFFNVCIRRNNQDDAFLSRIENYDHFLSELAKLTSENS